MDDRRKFDRKYLLFYSRIFDRKSGKMIGYILDLTPEGAMIIGEESIDSDTTFRLRMDLPEDVSPDKTYLDFEAKSVWCKRDADPHFYDTGFQLYNVTEEDVKIIQKVIEVYGFRSA